jgi:tripartite-type tricarboxylate transporter receptor subunit TctC
MNPTFVGRRAALHALSLPLAAAVGLPAAAAQSAFPQPGKPIRLVIPFAPGGVTDTSGRLVADRLTQRLGVQVVPDNRPGASGSIGTALVVGAEPDGHTLMLALDGSLVINPHVMAKQASFVPTRDLAPVGKVGDSTIILVAHPSLEARTLREVIALSKSRAGGLDYGTSGTASIVHIAGELLAQKTGAKLVHVPYKGGGLAVSDVVAGHIPLAFVSAASVQAYIKAGKLHAIAVPSGKRSPSFPEVATFAENGVADFDVNSWVGLMAPAATPKPVLARLNAELNAVLADPDVKSRLQVMGIAPTPGTAEAFAASIDADYRLFGKVVKTAGIRLD